MSDFVEITIRLPAVAAYGPPDEISVPAMSCRRCRKDFDDGERIAKFDRSWFCLDCLNSSDWLTRLNWCAIADHIAERPSQQTAATIKATLQNLAAMARGQWR